MPSRRCFIGASGLAGHSTAATPTRSICWRRISTTSRRQVRDRTGDGRFGVGAHATSGRPTTPLLRHRPGRRRSSRQDEFLIDRARRPAARPRTSGRLSAAEAPAYWRTHHVPGDGPTRELPKRIGTIKADLVGHQPRRPNPAVRLRKPTPAASGCASGALDAPRTPCPPRTTATCAAWQARRSCVRANAFQSQALLQLATETPKPAPLRGVSGGSPPAGSAQTVRPRRRIPQPTLTL